MHRAVIFPSPFPVLTICDRLLALVHLVDDYCVLKVRGGGMADDSKALLLGMFYTLVRTIKSVRVSIGRSAQIRAALATLILTGCASSNPAPETSKMVPQLDRIEVVNYGIVASHENCDRGAGEACATTIFDFTATTVTVPAQQGVQFGIAFRPVGIPDGAPVKLHTVWIFAPIDSTSPTSSHRSETSSTAVLGRVSIRTYRIDQPWELVPAVCTMEIWEGNRQLSSQSFNVIKR